MLEKSNQLLELIQYILLLNLLKLPNSVSLLKRNLIRQAYHLISLKVMIVAFVTYTPKIVALTVRSPQREHAIQCRPKQSTKQCVIAKNTLFLSAQSSLSFFSVWPVHDFSSSLLLLSALSRHQWVNTFWTVQLITTNSNVFESCIYKNNFSFVKITLFKIFKIFFWRFDIVQNDSNLRVMLQR